MNTRANKYPIDGILVLDKPEGLTSNAALQIVKKLYAAEKAGHTGSLDPLASGLLPLCFGEATKFSQHLFEADKKYQVTAQLGIKTSTGDREGETIATQEIPQLTHLQLKTALDSFKGSIEQIPSMFSALKHQGQPLYKLARKGLEVERLPRRITIHDVNLLSVQLPYFSFDVHCSKGTYIRTLVEDIGSFLNSCAHVTALRRTHAGPFDPSHMHALVDLQKTQTSETLKSYLLPIDSALMDWPNLTVSEAAFYYLRRGQPVILPYAPPSGWVRLTRHNGEFLGVAEILSDGKVAPRRLVLDK